LSNSSDVQSILEGIDVSTMKFVVLWSKGKNLASAQVRIAGEVTEHLQKACNQTVERLRTKERHPYFPDMGHEESEQVIFVDDRTTVESSPVGIALFANPELPLITAREIREKRLTLYAVITGVEEQQKAFIRKTNPRYTVKAGRLLTAFTSTLTRIEEPILEIDDHFDVVISPQGSLTSNKKMFESLFRDIPALQERIPEWSQEIANFLPVAAGFTDRLTQRCVANSQIRQRLSAVYMRGHLRGLTIDRLSEYLNAMDMEESRFIKNGQIDMADGEMKEFLYILNEDYFIGGFSGSKYRSHGKASV